MFIFKMCVLVVYTLLRRWQAVICDFLSQIAKGAFLDRKSQMTLYYLLSRGRFGVSLSPHILFLRFKALNTAPKTDIH